MNKPVGKDKFVDLSDSHDRIVVRGWNPVYIFFAGLVLTLLLTISTYQVAERRAREEFISVSNEIGLRIEARLQAHALILQAGAAFFAVSDTVTRQEWKEYVELSEVLDRLPGIQGLGFSYIIPNGELQEHIEQVRQEGFPDYSVKPETERDTYTSILYLEPFSGRNLRAFGFDMFAHPVRRQAMELSRDNNVPMLSGKVELVQETGEDDQAGTLMYHPLYRKGMPVGTVEERRAAIYGWVYSPYRMRDLMQGILGRWDSRRAERIRLQIYDETLSESSILFDSQRLDFDDRPDFFMRRLVVPVEFNGKNWVLQLIQPRDMVIFSANVIVVFFSGLMITFLLYLLSVSLSKVSASSRQVREQNEELKRLNATKDKFFSIIAHDLKSPFNAIVGFSRILIEKVNKNELEGVSRYAEIIHQSSNMAMGLLMNLMEWSQSQTGRMEYNPERFNLVELINHVEMLLGDVAKQKSIEIENKLPSSVPVYADHAMVSTVLRNLISNSIKFTHTGGKITVSTSENHDEHVVSVADNGVGIPEEKLDILFRIDKNFSTKGTQNEKGTGLGLVLCKEFVEKNGGRIWAESHHSKEQNNGLSGSVFYFTIPKDSPE